MTEEAIYDQMNPHLNDPSLWIILCIKISHYIKSRFFYYTDDIPGVFRGTDWMCWGIWNWGGHQRPHHASPQHCDDPRTKHVLNSSVKVTPRQPGNLDLWTHLCYFALNDYVSILIFLVGQINVFMGPPHL